MKRLSTLNIRKGLELEVPIEDIFKIESEADGDIMAMRICLEGWHEIPELKNKTYDDIFDTDDTIMYSTNRKKHKLNSSLVAYVRETYIASLEYPEEKIVKLDTEEFTEIDFVNTKRVGHRSFLKNIMKAQEFTGQFDVSKFKQRFIGFGTLAMNQFIESYNIISYSNVHLLDFYIFSDDNILSSIGDFLLANYVKDIEQQKEYYTTEEYNNLIEQAEKHRKTVGSEIEKLWNKMTRK